LLRCSPTWKFKAHLESFDEMMRDSLGEILNINIDDYSWTQASFPVARGGLGIRSARDISISAFLASVAGTSVLVSSILSSWPNLSDSTRDEALVTWLSLSGNAEIPDTDLQQA
jgi:hypothetical protein